jgi:hypothetical protein
MVTYAYEDAILRSSTVVFEGFGLVAADDIMDILGLESL